MGLDTVIVQWRDAERHGDDAAKKQARDGLVTALWEAYAPRLRDTARRGAPGQQSDILISAFRKFCQQVEQGKVEATTPTGLFSILRRRILDKVFEAERKDARRRMKCSIFAENELVRPTGASDEGSGVVDGIAQLAISHEPPPEFRAMIDELFEAVPDPRLREVLILKIEHLEGSGSADPEAARSKAEIARILGVSGSEVGRRLKRVQRQLAYLYEDRNACPRPHRDRAEGGNQEGGDE